MKMMLMILLVVSVTSFVAAQDCGPDGVCDQACINNTIDEFDIDCGAPERGLYTRSPKASTTAAEKMGGYLVPAVLQQLCPQIKDGVCETTCSGVDLDCLCGDFECQEHESAATCPTDCRYEENVLCAVVHDGHCDLGCRLIDADCSTQAIAKAARMVQARYRMSEHAVYATLAIILMTLCAIAIVLMHKAFELKKEQEGRRGR